MGIAYAIWAGVGVALIALVGYAVFRQPLDAPAIVPEPPLADAVPEPAHSARVWESIAAVRIS